MSWKKIIKARELEDWLEDNGFSEVTDGGYVLDEYLSLEHRFDELHSDEKGEETFSRLFVDENKLIFDDEDGTNRYPDDERKEAIEAYKDYIQRHESKLKELRLSGNRSRRFLRDRTKEEGSRLKNTSVKKVAKGLSNALEEVIQDFDYEINAIEIVSESEGLLKYLEQIRETQMSLEEEYL